MKTIPVITFYLFEFVGVPAANDEVRPPLVPTPLSAA